MRLTYLIFLLVILAGCQPAKEPDGELVCVDCYKVPATGAERVPGQVSGLKAIRSDDGIQLAWPSSKHATEYEVYRMEWLATGSPKTKYTRLAATSELLFTDATVELWNEYSYTVVAVNKSGHAKPSEAARIKVFPYAGWVESWRRAPALTDYALTWIPIATEGGDYGLNTTTELANDAAIENCSKTGVVVKSIRPAQGSYLGKSLQTISILLQYNTDNEIWRYYFGAYLRQGLFPSDPSYILRNRQIFRDAKVFQGCGSEVVTFSADLRDHKIDFDAYSGYLSVYLVAGDSHGSQATYPFGYIYFDRRPWVAVRSTWPELGAYLSKGELEVVLDYDLDNRQKIDVLLRHGTIENQGPVFGHAVTTIEGTGTVTLKVPYDSVCGENTGFLSLRREHPSTLERGDRFVYPTVSNDLYELVVVGANRSRHHYIPGEFYENLWILSCTGNETARLVAPKGWLVGPYSDWTTTTATGPTGYNWGIVPEQSTFDSMSYGEHVTYVTAVFSGATITAPVQFSVQKLFWKDSPPAKPVGGISYQLAVTVAGPKPFSEVAFVNWNLDTASYSIGEYRLTSLLWSDEVQAYIGETDFPSCGDAYTYIVDPLHPYYWEILSFQAPVQSSVTYKITVRGHQYPTEPSDPFPYVGLFNINGSDLGPKSIFLEEGCGKPFHWKVKAAPSWVHFESLSGTDQTPVRIAVFPDRAFTHGKSHAIGAVELLIDESNQVFAFDVEAAY